MANVDADVLIIDEALAVGDFVFTQKCMRFLREFKENGTLVFVSHDTQAVIRLCRTAAWLEQGTLRAYGNAKEICEEYLRVCLEAVHGGDVRLARVSRNRDTSNAMNNFEYTRSDPTTSIQFFHTIDSSEGWTSGGAEIVSAYLLNEEGEPLERAAGGELVCLEIKARALRELYSPIVGFALKDRLGQVLFGENTYSCENMPATLAPGQVCTSRFKFFLPLLPNGDYSITVAIATGTIADYLQHHRLHDVILLVVSSEKARYGLVGIPFKEVSLEIT
jgi:lipopolysaccharide transport system ATP-binding protein